MPKKEWEISSQFFSENPHAVKCDKTTPHDTDQQLEHTYVKACDGVIYQLGDAIGSGANGKVIWAYDQGGHVYAMKISGTSNRQENKTATDLAMLASPEFGCPVNEGEGESYQSEDGVEFYAPMRYLGKSIESYLKQNKNLTLQQRCDLAAKIFIAMHQFHQGESSCSGTKYTHGDINPKNIVIDNDGNVHIIDVELVNRNVDAPRSTVPDGSLAYMAPESIELSGEQAGRLATMRSIFMDDEFFDRNGKNSIFERKCTSLIEKDIHFIFKLFSSASKHYQEASKTSVVDDTEQGDEISSIISSSITAVTLAATQDAAEQQFINQKIRPLLTTTCQAADGSVISTEEFQATFPKSDLDLATKIMLLKPGCYGHDATFNESWSGLQKQSIVNLSLVNCQEATTWQRILNDDLSLQIAITSLGKLGQEHLTQDNITLLAASKAPIQQMVGLILPERLQEPGPLNRCDAMLHDKKLNLINKTILLLGYLNINDVSTWQKVVGNDIAIQQSLVMLGKFDPDLINDTAVHKLSSARKPIDDAIDTLKKVIAIPPTAPGGKPYRELLNVPQASPLRKAIIVLALKKLHQNSSGWAAVVTGNTQLHYAIAALKDCTDTEIDDTTKTLTADSVAQDIIYELAKYHPEGINLRMVKSLVAKNSWLKKSFLLLEKFSVAFCDGANIILLCANDYSAIATRILLGSITFNHAYYQNLYRLYSPPIFADMARSLTIEDNDIWSAILDMTMIKDLKPSTAQKQFIRKGLALEASKKATAAGSHVEFPERYARDVHFTLFSDEANRDAETEFMQAVTVMLRNQKGATPAKQLVEENKFFSAAATLLGIEVDMLDQTLTERQQATQSNKEKNPKKHVKAYEILKKEALDNGSHTSKAGLFKSIRDSLSSRGSVGSRDSNDQRGLSITSPRSSGGNT